jgi:hypothetical protein
LPYTSHAPYLDTPSSPQVLASKQHHFAAFATLEILRPSRDQVEQFELFELPGPQLPYQEREGSVKERERGRRRQEKLEWLLQKAEMKFSHSLQFNAVPDWSSHYINYSNLKKL